MSAYLLGNRTLTLGFAVLLGVVVVGAQGNAQRGAQESPRPGAGDAPGIGPDGNRVSPEPIGRPAAPSIKKSSGELDPSFAGDGTTWSYLPGYNGGTFENDVAEAVAVDAAGGIIVATHGERDPSYLSRAFAILRYNADGTPDMTFGSNGLAAPFAGQAGRVRAMVIQPDGRIVVAGSAGFSVARLMADGSLDASFGSGGQVQTLIRGQAYAMALQTDGRIVLAGYAEPVQGAGSVLALARYDSDGSLDVSFGAGGVVLGDSPGIASAVAVQPDGRIVVVGGAFLVTRFNADGTLDAGFGSGGQVVVPFGEVGFDSLANAILVQPDGRIVVAGGTTLSRYDFAIARLDPDGNLDQGFGHDGMVTTDFNGGFDQIRALVLQPDGRIVAAGYGGPAHRLPNDNHFALARYEPNGALDRSFGQSGRAMAVIDDPIYSDFARALALQPDGRLVAAGNVRFFCETGGCNLSGYALACFLP